MIASNISIIAVIAIYFSFLMLLGIKGFKKTKTFQDYVIGGRSLGSIVGAMNVGASDMSSWLLMGLPGAFYLFGVNQIWIVIGLILGSFASWKLVAPRLRVYSESANNSITISAFLENRFNDTTRVLRLTTSIIILFFFTIYIASGFVGSAKLFSSIFQITYKQALGLSIFIIILYALVGGFLAVSWADLLQGILILFTLVIVPVGMIVQMGGMGEVVSLINTVSPSHFNPFYNMDAAAIISLLGWGLGYFGQPHIISKYMSIKDVASIKIATKICIVWMTLSMIAAGAIGLFGFAFFLNSPLVNHEAVFIFSSNILFPTVVMGFVISAILAAIMSTINGQLLISCATLSEDFYKRFFRKNAENKELLIISRVFIIIIVLITYFIAQNERGTVLSLVAYAWSGLGAAIGPVIICSLFVKRTTKLGAILGVISGCVSSIIFAEWKVFSYELFPAFAISFLIIIISSYLDKQTKDEAERVEQIFKKF